jgi:hypothetical protein
LATMLTCSVADARSGIDTVIVVGEKLRDDLKHEPPISSEGLLPYLDRWLGWRRGAETYMERLFSTSEMLDGLNAIEPTHMRESSRAWQERTTDLVSDVERDLMYFRDLWQRLSSLPLGG